MKLSEILSTLQNIDENNSGDDISDLEDENDIDDPPYESSSSDDSQSDSDTNEEFLASPPEQLQEPMDIELNQMGDFAEPDIVKAKDGTIWKNITGIPGRGRASMENIFRQKPGPTSYSVQGICPDDPLSAFRLFIDEPMLRKVRKYTIGHAQRFEDENFSLSLSELEIFIGLII